MAKVLASVDHIKGKLYMGEVCCRIITEMDLEEVSFVENPTNKHCRVLTIETGGKTIDILTLREQSTTANSALAKAGLTDEQSTANHQSTTVSAGSFKSAFE